MSRTPLAALLAGLFTAPLLAHADEPTLLDTIVVTATRIATPDVDAPYASEVHTRHMIEQSGATTLYDYLAQHTSVQVMPSFGSRAMPLLDMRGFGLESGYQNIVVSVDGQRLNNIDQVPQLIGAIPLQDIERIEITKGSGAVMYGDGATGGSIQIYPRTHNGVSLAGSAGSHGARAGTLTAGKSGERFSASVSADYNSLDGVGATDATGHRDASLNRNWRGVLELRPVAALKLRLGADSARLDNRYVYPLTLSEFQADPSQFPAAYAGKPYNHQTIASDHWRLGAELELAPDWRLAANHGREDRASNFIAWYGPWPSSYDYDSNDLSLQYRGRQLDASIGMQSFKGVRNSSTDRTGKDNAGGYAQGQYRLDDWTFSAGARVETVKYSYAPDVGAALQGQHRLNAWDLGLNRRLNNALSVFANIDQAFLAPDIDRFFVYDFATGAYAFNAFIAPEKSRTFNLGLNRTDPANRLKIAVFYSDLRDEIYFDPGTFANTNLARTHKSGLELQDNWRMSPSWQGSFNYTYTRAVVDHQTAAAGTYDGKDLPGVPRQGAVLGLTYSPAKGSNLSLTHAWREATWAIGDFTNHNVQRQAAYQSTDVAYHHRIGDLEWYAAVDNLFAHRNGLWTGDDSIYPVNFTRNLRLGLSARF